MVSFSRPIAAAAVGSAAFCLCACSPFQAGLSSGRAQNYLKEGNTDAALAEAERAVALYASPVTYNARAAANAQAGNYDRALHDWLLTLALDPSDEEAMRGFAEVLRLRNERSGPNDSASTLNGLELDSSKIPIAILQEGGKELLWRPDLMLSDRTAPVEIQFAKGLQVESIDGIDWNDSDKPFDVWGSASIIKVLPGPHTIVVSYRASFTVPGVGEYELKAPSCEVSFTAETKKKYRLSYVTRPSDPKGLGLGPFGNAVVGHETFLGGDLFEAALHDVTSSRSCTEANKVQDCR